MPYIKKNFLPSISLEENVEIIKIPTKRAHIICTMINQVTNNDKHLIMGENCVISGSMHFVFQSEGYSFPDCYRPLIACIKLFVFPF